jgi:hypothetical protein
MIFIHLKKRGLRINYAFYMTSCDSTSSSSFNSLVTLRWFVVLLFRFFPLVYRHSLLFQPESSESVHHLDFCVLIITLIIVQSRYTAMNPSISLLGCLVALLLLHFVSSTSIYDMTYNGNPSLQVPSTCPRGNAMVVGSSPPTFSTIGFSSFQWGLDVTVAMWFNVGLNDMDSAEQRVPILNFGNTFYLALNEPSSDDDNDAWIWAFVGTKNCPSTASKDCILYAVTKYQDWNHAALVANGTYTSLYVNGILLDTAVNVGSVESSQNTFFFGAITDSSDFDSNSMFGDFRIYTRALNATEIALLGSNPARPLDPELSDGLLAFYDFADPLNLGANQACTDPLNVTSISPMVVTTAGGESVTIFGSGFQSNAKVLLNYAPVIVISVSPSEIVIKIPAGAECGNAQISITCGACSISPMMSLFVGPSGGHLIGPDTVQVNDPTNITIVPNCAPTLPPRCLWNGGNETIGLISSSSNEVICMSPSILVGEVILGISVDGGTNFFGNYSILFFVPPTISSLMPSFVLDNETSSSVVVVSGSNLAWPSIATHCLVDSFSLSSTSVSSTSIQCNLPPLGLGNHDISVVVSGSSSNELPFVVVASAAVAQNTIVNRTSASLSQCFMQSFVISGYNKVGNLGPLDLSSINATISGPAADDAVIVQIDEFHVLLTFMPVLLGSYSIDVAINGVPIQNSPLIIFIQPMSYNVQSVDPPLSLIDSSSLPNNFTVVITGTGFTLSCDSAASSDEMDEAWCLWNGIVAAATVVNSSIVVCDSLENMISGTYSLQLNLSGIVVLVQSHYLVAYEPVLLSVTPNALTYPTSGQVVVTGSNLLIAGLNASCSFDGQLMPASILSKTNLTCSPTSFELFGVFAITLEYSNGFITQPISIAFCNCSYLQASCNINGTCSCFAGYAGINCNIVVPTTTTTTVTTTMRVTTSSTVTTNTIILTATPASSSADAGISEQLVILVIVSLSLIFIGLLVVSAVLYVRLRKGNKADSSLSFVRPFAYQFF